MINSSIIGACMGFAIFIAAAIWMYKQNNNNANNSGSKLSDKAEKNLKIYMALNDIEDRTIAVSEILEKAKVR